METGISEVATPLTGAVLYSLEKLVEWKSSPFFTTIGYPSILGILYSLEKLVEWKHTGVNPKIYTYSCYFLYSLEKLVEWKHG